jgi:cyclomaltodextrinase
MKAREELKPDPWGGLTRRRLLGSGAAAAAALLSEAPWARAFRSNAARPELLPVSADVWSSEVAVTGGPSGAVLTDAGRTIATTPSGRGFSAIVSLSPAGNVLVADNGAGRRAAQTYTARLRSAPTARVTMEVTGNTLQLDASSSERDPYTRSPLRRFAWTDPGGAQLGNGERLRLEAPFADGEHIVHLAVTDLAGASDMGAALFCAQKGAPVSVDSDYQPEWIRRAIAYGVIPPLFGTPPLDAVTAALGRLSRLGVNVLWLAPIFATVPGDFGYAVTDHFAVRPDYGDLAALRRLVVAAHSRGIRVILDMPLNDTSSRHPYFLQAQRFKEAESRYWTFYERGPNGEPVHYFSWRKLPNLSYESSEVRRLALEAAAFWLREAGVDGFRCDAAWGVSERAPGFWSEWADEVRRIRPDALLLAEAPARSDVPDEEGFDAAYDWGEQLGEWAWRGAFSRRGVSLPSLAHAITQPQPTRPFRFLDNNDTGTRFIAVNGPDVTRAALALLLTLPGIPCIYTGEEIGADYLPYKQTRPLAWSSDPDQLEALIKRLCAQRLARPALQCGLLRTLDVTPSDVVIAFEATLPGERLVVAVNMSDEPVTAEIPLMATAIRIDAWSAEVREV